MAVILVRSVGGWAAPLAVAGYTTMAVRRLVRTKLQPAEQSPKLALFSLTERKILASTTVLFFNLAIWSPNALGTTALTCLPFYLSATTLGYAVESNFSVETKKVLHPIITCALIAYLIVVFAYGALIGQGFDVALGNYLTKKAGNPRAEDLLMSILGSVILSFVFSMFHQRKLVQRHFAEIFSAMMTSLVFSLYSTTLASGLLQLPPRLTAIVIPRCITVALALPISSLLEEQNPTIITIAIVLTGLVGANFAQIPMDKLNFTDHITRGLAIASSAHGLGTATLSAKKT